MPMTTMPMPTTTNNDADADDNDADADANDPMVSGLLRIDFLVPVFHVLPRISSRFASLYHVFLSRRQSVKGQGERRLRRQPNSIV
jgi:hypothetical protein